MYFNIQAANQSTTSSSSQGASTTTITTTQQEGAVGTEGYATPVCNTQAGSTKITLVAERAKVQIAKNVTYDGWSFNGTIPGPTIWVNLCENVEFTLINNDTVAHSIDFHAAQVNWATVYAPVLPGKSLSFNFTPAYPGIFMYHCGVPPVLEHIANGMYGVIIVNGTGNWALPPAPGGTYVLTESEFYLNGQPGADGSYTGNYTKMFASTPDYVVFNGEAFQYQVNPIMVKPNQLVRLYVFNEGPNLWEAFHVIGSYTRHRVHRRQPAQRGAWTTNSQYTAIGWRDSGYVFHRSWWVESFCEPRICLCPGGSSGRVQGRKLDFHFQLNDTVWCPGTPR